MGAPHNPARLGELWDATRLTTLLDELKAMQSYIVISGGWAWHFMTPRNKHSSAQCFSVRIASRLLAQGINPIGRPEMATYSEFLNELKTIKLK